MEEPQIILCIPGKWKNKSEMIEMIIRSSDEFVLIGNRIVKLDNLNMNYEIEIYGHDENLAEAFEIAGGNAFTKEQLNEIQNHFLTAYLIGNGGTIDNLIKLIEVSNVLLKAGGLGVKVEVSGTATTPESWSIINSKKEIPETFKAFVTVAEEDDFYYTCGMHCFGLPDVITFKNQVSIEYAQELMQIFCLYNLIEKPYLEDGSTFSLAEEHPIFVLRYSDCRHIPEDHLFYNKYGVWALAHKFE
ncbi:DUF4261 domain-containing protein [Lysinibacillus sp. NPDC059133]|uniref:DUF4261 domain-containing protein n=1 Tax=Lysinibacillus sp. NPDC059133 TaxID=3346737 RepID=UPI0036C28184